MPDVFVSDQKDLPAKEKDLEDSTPLKILHSNHPSAEIHKDKFHTHSPLSSYFYFPDSVKFIAKDSKEKIVLLLRRHPITNVPWIIVSLLMFAAPMVLSTFPLLSFMPDRFQFVSILIWYMVTIAFTFESFLNWFFSVYIITDERLFDVDFINLIYREISEANLEQIQEVTTKMGGVIRTVFDYGGVHIQTASDKPNIEFEAVPHPDQVAKIIRELRVEEEQEKIEGRVN